MGGGQTAFFLTWLAFPGRSWAPGLSWLAVPLPTPNRVFSLYASFSMVLDIESELTPYLSHADFTWLVHLRVVYEG